MDFRVSEYSGSQSITSSDASAPVCTARRPHLVDDYRQVRSWSEELARPLNPEDFLLQSMTDASPPKWHLAHTTWFFETFILRTSPHYQPFHPEFNFLFNSYYIALGERHPRPIRGLISRPTVGEVFEYRARVDEAIVDRIEKGLTGEQIGLLQLGLAHEEQHQELLLTDLKHAFAQNCLFPVYRERALSPIDTESRAGNLKLAEGLYEIGFDPSGSDFAFDIEKPRHQIYLQEVDLSPRLVTNREFLEFMETGGYDRPEYWLSDGWDWRQREAIESPLYWREDRGEWWTYTLSGAAPLELDEPVTHVSYFEADAYARYRGLRLPTEAEWEVAATQTKERQGLFLEERVWHPVSDRDQAFAGTCWNWTQSPFTPYPGYQPAPGALGEYNSKFMCNQMVLRGGSCFTPRRHYRTSYRNFFAPESRWQVTGIRLASGKESHGLSSW